MRAFSREALQCYVPVITEEVGSCLERWLRCGERGLLVYPQVKRLMFRIAMRILLGCEPRLASGGDAEQQLAEAFEEMTRNLFSLPIDVPFSGLYRVTAAPGRGAGGEGARRPAPAHRGRSPRAGREGAEPHPRAHRGEHSRQDLRAAGGRGGRRLQRRAAAADRALVGAGGEAGHAGEAASEGRCPRARAPCVPSAILGAPKALAWGPASRRGLPGRPRGGMRGVETPGRRAGKGLRPDRARRLPGVKVGIGQM